jgi:hypothetical protein
MDKSRVWQVAQFILAVAGEDDAYRNRELGPIHLIKYLYLADLAYAERHEGESYLGVEWIFLHFGPWSAAIHKELSPALVAAGADEKRFASRFSDDFVRWRLDDRGATERLEAGLPPGVSHAVRKAVRSFGSDTRGLLHFVYATSPMVHAAPGEVLQMASGVRRPAVSGPMPTEEGLESRREQRKHQAELAQIRSRFRQALASAHSRQRRIAASPAPRYDAVFFAGLPDEREEPPFIEAEVEFADGHWKSDIRSDPDVP